MADGFDFSTQKIIRETFLAVCNNKADILNDLLPKLNNNLDISFYSSTKCRAKCSAGLEVTEFRYISFFRFLQCTAEQMADIIEKGRCDHIIKYISKKQLVSFSLLHFACYFGHLEIVKLLIEHGADVCSESTPAHYTPVQMVIRSKNSELIMVDIMSLLLDKGGNPSHRDATDGQTILHTAINLGYLSIVNLLLKYNCDIDAEDNNGATALSLAVTSKRIDIVKVLVASNADVNKGSRSDPVPLIAAVKTGEYEIVKALLSTPLKNMEINKSRKPTSRPEGTTALRCAVNEGRIDMVTLLLTHKADVNYVGMDGKNPLIASLMFRNNELFRELIKFGADVNHRGFSGYAAIHEASLGGNNEVVDILLQRGCDYDTRAEDGKTPLALACQGGRRSICIALKLMNLSVNVKNIDEYLDTPLHYASSEGCIETCRRLVELEADPSARNKDNLTPLWCAVYASSRSVVKLLIQRNVSLNVASRGYVEHQLFGEVCYDEPKTPLYVTFGTYKDPYIAAMLIIAGVNLSEEKWLRSTDLEVFNKSPGSAPHVDLLRSYTESPVSLKRLCRDEIRRRLATRLADALPLFGLPASLTDYLLIKHDLQLCEAGTLDLLQYKFD